MGLRFREDDDFGKAALTSSRYPTPMRFAALFLLLATPAFAQDAPHSGVAHARTGPALSDAALFLMAVAGVFLARRAMRAKSRRD
ncbi:hypothetical protein BH09PSE4_BH09PSE4_14900 [soil metagenome]